MNIGALLSKSATMHAKKTALLYGRWEETYFSLDARVNRLATALLAIGLKKGDSVALMQRDSPQLVESLFGCFKAGLKAVPMNAKLHKSEFSYILTHSEAKAVIFGERFKETIEDMRGELPNLNYYICLREPGERDLDYERLLSDGSEEAPSFHANGHDIAWLFYTSGTTGRPKGAMLTHRNLIEMTMSFLASIYPASQRDIALHAAPLTHGSGLYILPLIARGASNIILESESFEPAKLLTTVAERKVTILPFLVPTMIKMLLSTRGMESVDLSNLKCIVYGGSPMYVEDLKAAVKRFGMILVQIYGQGEAPMTISYLPKEEHILDGDPKQSKRLLSAGIAHTNVEIQIVDNEDRELPSGQVGEIAVRGEVVMKGYWRDVDSTADTMKNGWLHTGDLGYIDEDGYIYIVDRKKDMVITGGSNVYSREVEDVILQHPAVKETVVIGVPDPLWGEAVKAVVVRKLGEEVSEQEIIDFCKDHLASYKKPKSVEFVQEIPKSAYGKVLRREIREKYWRGMETRVH